MDRAGAYLASGDASAIEAMIAFLEAEGVAVRGNPDVYARAYGSFGVDDARELSARAAGKAIGADGRIFIIAADAYTTEAQNALLKTLEEPAGNARFFLIAPAPMQLLATLRSRMQMLALPEAAGTAEAVPAAAFLSASPSERLDMLKPLLEKNDDDRRDTGAALAFLAALERSLAKNAFKSAPSREGIEAIYRARRFICDRGALWKPLLEQVALLAPVM